MALHQISSMVACLSVRRQSRAAGGESALWEAREERRMEERWAREWEWEVWREREVGGSGVGVKEVEVLGVERVVGFEREERRERRWWGREKDVAVGVVVVENADVRVLLVVFAEKSVDDGSTISGSPSTSTANVRSVCRTGVPTNSAP
ncbi:hypothetical protein HDU93_001588 [Gonapodya sp. JEL0774]|nr:hypothetical protein HDU93_001588 [Gonapodya sp. JEL0774]